MDLSLSCSWPSFRDLSSFSIHFSNTLSPPDHQPSQAPNKTPEQNTWTARFPIPAAATEKWGEDAKAEIDSP